MIPGLPTSAPWRDKGDRADNDLAITKFLRANLEAIGYKTLTAIDGAEALQTTEMELPDLVILDIMMPKNRIR